MPDTGRRSHQGAALARALGIEAAKEIREARRNAGLSQRAAARAAGMSASQFGRLERGEIRRPKLEQICRAGAAVGLRMWLRAFPDGDPIRDAGHVRRLERFRAPLGPAIRWRTEVPVHGAQAHRGWDCIAEATPERIGVEAETRFRDAQATWRKAQRKLNDDPTVGPVILLVADTKANRRAPAMVRESLRADLPLDTRAVLAALRE